MRNTKGNVPMKLACLLLILVMLTTYMTSGLYARYVATGTGEDSARVIKFHKIALRDTDKKIIITPGVPSTRDVAVSFDGSEATTYIFVEMELSNHWSVSNNGRDFNVRANSTNYISFSIDTTKWGYMAKYSGSNKYIYYFKGANTVDGVLQPNNTVSFDQANILANAGTITVSDRLTMSYFKNLAGLSMEFRATAVQANGFEDIDEAWESIAAKGL